MGSRVGKYKRGRIWYLRVDGASHSSGLTDERAAEALRRRRELELADPAVAASRRHTLADALVALIDDKRRRGRSEHTLATDRHRAAHFERILGTVSLADLASRDVDRYVERRLRETITHTSPVRTVTRHTVGKELALLRAALDGAKRGGIFAGDPRAVTPARWASGYRPRETYLERDQVDGWLEQLDPAKAARLAWILALGARWGESDRARRDDHDLGRGVVRIRGTKTGASDAFVPVPPQTRDLLDRALRDAPGADGGRLFARWLPSNARREMAAASRRAGVPQVTPNDLRRSTATWLAWAGVPLDVARVVLRHTTARMLERVYARWTPQAAARLMAQAGPIPSDHPGGCAADGMSPRGAGGRHGA
jgi:integrase